VRACMCMCVCVGERESYVPASVLREGSGSSIIISFHSNYRHFFYIRDFVLNLVHSFLLLLLLKGERRIA